MMPSAEICFDNTANCLAYELGANIVFHDREVARKLFENALRECGVVRVETKLLGRDRIVLRYVFGCRDRVLNMFFVIDSPFEKPVHVFAKYYKLPEKSRKSKLRKLIDAVKKLLRV